MDRRRPMLGLHQTTMLWTWPTRSASSKLVARQCIWHSSSSSCEQLQAADELGLCLVDRGSCGAMLGCKLISYTSELDSSEEFLLAD